MMDFEECVLYAKMVKFIYNRKQYYIYKSFIVYMISFQNKNLNTG